ncbi:bifunctional autolysin [Virgibacillus halotolerans]|uniref:N-acetylglucosaminidase n=1 Tax=Virgibacillus halotolerans TaxID=1071053 RepID=UPI001961B31F|nr:N-acetylglucosaminidase [Virgibacillus halotolerans]MBM7600168.1 bifunctional autolysin [Virgibacillus halotolerans]
MRKTAIFLIVLLTFSLISPYVALAEDEKAKTDTLNPQLEEMDEDQEEISIEESEESLLGHITDANVKVYEDLNDLSLSEKVESNYMDKVYYIAKQAKIDDQLYYLISNEESDEKGQVGWIKSQDLEIQSFVIVDEEEKTLFINGSGEAYNNAWGGKEDIVYDLAELENVEFNIDITQKVGGDTWYRGILNDETVWIQASNLKEDDDSENQQDGENAESDTQTDDSDSVDEPEKSNEIKDDEQQKSAASDDENMESDTQTNDIVDEPETSNEIKDDEVKKEFQDDAQTEEDETNSNSVKSDARLFMRSTVAVAQESKTSKLGHIRSTNVDIYQNINDLSASKKAGDKFINAVYYIKKQAKVNNQSYYLISTEPSSTKGVVGWVKSQDLSSHSHVGVDKKTKIFTVKGSGNAYNTAWGGNKNLVYNLSKYKNQVFNVHLTEKVGNNTWYRGTLNGKTVWIHSSYLNIVKESKTSKLGHIRNSKVKIYKDIGNESTVLTAGSKYTNAVYYIKKQTKVNNQSYYLISTEPSSTKGVVGWVKSQDLSSHSHVGVDKKAKIFTVKGSGNAYNTAWGGNKNLVYNLSKYKNQVFNVHLTEKVGNNTWYRGTLNGKTVWIHSSYLNTVKESKTSRLGHIRSGAKIYKNIGDESSSMNSTKYLNAVYYIKKQANVGSQLYYLISTEPSSTKNVVGWVKSQDLSTHPHVGVDKKVKTYYVKGTGKAYDTAWGGSENLVYNLSQYKSNTFKIHLTEKVGNNTWYRGVLNGKTVWIHGSYLSKSPLKEVINTYTNYNLTLNRMADIQMAVNPQTDKRYELWIREDALSIKNGKGTVNGDNWNLRRGPGTNYLTGGKVNNGTVLTLKANSKGSDGYTWYYVRDTSGWVIPDTNDLKYYINPSNFTSNLKNSLQFLKLSESANINVVEINEKILKGKGILAGRAQSFADGANKYGVNEIYLISHALLETGNGSSKLATGVKYNGKTVYNMYGIGANDSCPLECGSKYAYDAGWFTPELAIKGGAEFVGKNYLGVGQDTLYKMRWNPSSAASNGYATHQYATDIGWASKQTTRMYELYNLLDSYNMVLDIPEYK